MAFITFPLNNTDYTADDMALYFSGRTNGVFSADNELSVISNNTMNVTVKPGRAWLAPDTFKGYIFASTTDTNLTIDIADGILNRIDRVVIKYDIVANVSSLYIKKGTPNTNPTPPVLTRDKNVAWELAIADIYIGKGVTMIRPQDITDKRLDSSVCGLISDGINKIATDVLYNQFNDWFEHVKGQLGTDVAGNLQNQIDTWNEFKKNGGYISGNIVGVQLATKSLIDNKSWAEETHKDGYKIISSNTNPTTGDWRDEFIMSHDGFAGKYGKSLGTTDNQWQDIFLQGASKNTTGYTKLPNGMFMAWGSINVYTNNAGFGTRTEVTLPILFQRILNVGGTCSYNIDSDSDSYIENNSVSVCALTNQLISVKSKMIDSNVPNQTFQLRWFVLGY